MHEESHNSNNQQWLCSLDDHELVETLRNAFPHTSAPEGTHIRPAVVSGCSAEWVVSKDADPRRRILYLHGGGYVAGSIDTHRSFISRLSRVTRSAILSINYRLAPEHRFPSALEDAIEALIFASCTGPLETAKPDTLVIAGDSSGGGLALSACIGARNNGYRLPDGIIALSAWTDLAFTGRSLSANRVIDPIVSEQLLRRLAAIYLGEHNPLSPLASPIQGDLRGLPPLLMHTGELDTLADDTIRFAERAIAHGVCCKARVYPGMSHGFHLLSDSLAEANSAINDIGSFVDSLANCTDKTNKE